MPVQLIHISGSVCARGAYDQMRRATFIGSKFLEEREMLSWTIQEYLVRHNVPYEQMVHPRAITARQTAHAAHISESKVVKTVVLSIEGRMVMAVLHANEKIDLARLRESLGVQNARLCTEREFKDRFPDCEVGAMPPFGDLYRMPVIASRSVRADDEITMNAGTHEDLITMKYADFERLVHPISESFAYH